MRKKQLVSKYHRVVAKEKKNLGAWSAKLKKIYAEASSTVDEDPLERFGTKKKKKKRKNDVTVSSEQTACAAEMVAAAVHSDQVASQNSETRTSSETLSAAPDSSRLARISVHSTFYHSKFAISG